MATIEQLDPPGSVPALGRECRFAARGESLVVVDYFLEHEGVLYPHPLRVEPDGSIRLYPEAPGRYALHAAWRSERGESGWTQTEFHVRGALGSAPRKARPSGCQPRGTQRYSARTNDPCSASCGRSFVRAQPSTTSAPMWDCS